MPVLDCSSISLSDVSSCHRNMQIVRRDAIGVVTEYHNPDQKESEANAPAKMSDLFTELTKT